MKSLNKSSFNMKRIFSALGIAAVVAAFSVSSYALTPSYYTSTSKFASGKWVKVKTEGQGVHQITYDQLRQWGFSNPERVNVYGFGATALAGERFNTSIPDDITRTYTLHEGDKIFFYSSGVITPRLTSASNVTRDINFYSTDVYYFLSDIEGGNNIASAGYNPANNALSSHLSLNFIEEELQNPTEFGAYFLGRDIPTGGGLDIPFSIKNMSPGNTSWSTSYVYVYFAANNDSNTRIDVSWPSQFTNVSSSKSSASLLNDDYKKYNLAGTQLSTSSLVNDGTYVFRAMHPNSGQKFLAVDYSWMIYPRLNRMDDDSQLMMNFPQVNTTHNFSLSGTETTRVINVTDEKRVYEHNVMFKSDEMKLYGSFDTNYDNNGSFPACRLVAFDTEKPQKEVSFSSDIANQNLHGIQTPDMVIITTASLKAGAEQLAEIHRKYDGMDVVVVEHTSLFNEFSAGIPDVMGYRRFLKMLYDRNPSKLKNIILYGPANWDNRGILAPNGDVLLTYETTKPEYSGSITKAFGSDCYFGMLEDNYNPSNLISTLQSVPVGRIPVDDLTKAANINGKIEKYIQTTIPTSVYNTAIVMSDDGDINQHFNQAERIAEKLEETNPAMTVVRAHNLTYQWDNGDAKDLRAVTTNALNRGAGLFVYVGHGNEDAFGAEALWNRHFIQATSYQYPPLGFLATCFSFNYDRNREDIAKTFVTQPDGGLIALIGAGREVFGSYNVWLGDKVLDEYLSIDGSATIGEIWMRGRNNAIRGSSEHTLVNSMCYNLAGDPALRIYAPTRSVKLTGVELPEDENENIGLSALSLSTVSGEITDANGNVDENFNGTVTLELYDAPYEVSTIVRNPKADTLQYITFDQDILVTKTVNVANGKFTASFVAPIPVHEGLSNRLTMHADGDNHISADGFFGRFCVTSDSSNPDDIVGVAPSIDILSPSQNGVADVVFNSALPVRISASGTVDQVGLNTSAGIGSGSTLVIDGNRHIAGIKESIVLNPDNTWSLAVNVADLTAGNHSATLTIADNYGRRTSLTTTFTCDAVNDITLSADNETIRDAVTFDVLHSLGEIAESRLVIEDRMGNPVLNRQGVSFPCTIDMTRDAFGEVADGHYTAYVMLRSSAGVTASSKRLPVVMLQK